MKIIVGLGNVGKEYEGTRHNAGFMFVDKLVSDEEFSSIGESHDEKKFNAKIAEAQIKGEKIVVVKPNTYMNLSGEAVSKIMQFYKADIEDLIVISDDIDLPIGKVRVRLSGSSGGQKGLQNIIDLLGTDKFIRIRIGVNSTETDRRDLYETKDFVLSKPSEREKPVLEEAISDAVKVLIAHLDTKEPMTAHSFDIKFDSMV